ncbi:MAG: nucleoside hydrolase [Bacteroidales bacterium]|nr:nucleoside hydrolase [Bacteroidales bacterium]
MQRLRTIIVLLLFPIAVSAHPWKPKYYVMVDTDCGFDDLRALCLMLASPEIRILSITTSNGVLDAATGYHKVKSLLHDLHHEGLLVGANCDTLVKPAYCQPAANLQWGAAVSLSEEIPSALEVVEFVLNNISEPVVFISLGSLNTAAMCMERCSSFEQRIDRIYWSSGSDLTFENFNYSLDTGSVAKISGVNTEVYQINGETNGISYTESLTDQICRTGGLHAAKICSSTKQSDALNSQLFFDEIIPLFLHFPELFRHDTEGPFSRYTINSDVTSDQITTGCKKILGGETVNQNQVFDAFPMDTATYFTDVQKDMNQTIAIYGKEEWIAQTITAELHRHLGVYAVIGVKMGIRAKEYFGAGTDEMSVVSYAGNTTPTSCLNDGIQVSTGATLGHGLIHVAEDHSTLPTAEFTYMNRKIILSLKEEYRKKVEQEIREYNRIYGLSSDIYWELVRNAAIRCWMNWDRNEIFDIQGTTDMIF